MRQILFILLSLLLLGVQQGVASEKRDGKIKPTRQTKLEKDAAKGDGIAKGILSALNPPPVNIVAVHEYLQKNGHKSVLEEATTEKYITFQVDSLAGHIHVEDEYITFQTSLRNPAGYVARMRNQTQIGNRDIAITYKACIDLMNSTRCVKTTYFEDEDWVSVYVETYIPTMPIFERYFKLYMDILTHSSDKFVELLNNNIAADQK